MSGGPLRVDLETIWTYSHSLGGLSPYFRNLAVGRALATRCSRCARTWFPPRLRCREHGDTVDWTPLPGTGTVSAATLTTIVFPLSTRTLRAWLALISMDGAHNLAIGCLDSDIDVRHGQRVRLVADETEVPHPAQSARFVPLK
jgi:uncharacterized OB-fold protein